MQSQSVSPSNDGVPSSIPFAIAVPFSTPFPGNQPIPIALPVDYSTAPSTTSAPSTSAHDSSTTSIEANIAQISENIELPDDSLCKACADGFKAFSRLVGRVLALIGMSIGIAGGVVSVITGVLVGIAIGGKAGAVAMALIIVLGVTLSAVPSQAMGKAGIGLMYLGDAHKLDKKDFDKWFDAVNFCSIWPIAIFLKKKSAAVEGQQKIQPPVSMPQASAPPRLELNQPPPPDYSAEGQPNPNARSYAPPPIAPPPYDAEGMPSGNRNEPPPS